MEGPVAPPVRRTLTPAVFASSLFVVLCGAIAITFVASRGGLQMPVAAARSHVAVASGSPSAQPSPSVPNASTSATATAPTEPPTAAPSAAPTVAATAPPSEAPSIRPSPTPAGPADPLTALPGCADVPDCYEYTIRRGDSVTAVASRYAIDPSVVLALNPEVRDPGTIVVGQILYLGRSPFLRLPSCSDTPRCSLYTVRPGDRLSTIAGRFGITTAAILTANATLTDPNAIYSGQVLKLPHPTSK